MLALTLLPGNGDVIIVVMLVALTGHLRKLCPDQ